MRWGREGRPWGLARGLRSGGLRSVGLQRGPRSRLATRRSPRVLPWPPRVEPACSDWRLPYRPAPPVPPAGT